MEAEQEGPSAGVAQVFPDFHRDRAQQYTAEQRDGVSVRRMRDESFEVAKTDLEESVSERVAMKSGAGAVDGAVPQIREYICEVEMILERPKSKRPVEENYMDKIVPQEIMEELVEVVKIPVELVQNRMVEQQTHVLLTQFQECGCRDCGKTTYMNHLLKRMKSSRWCSSFRNNVTKSTLLSKSLMFPFFKFQNRVRKKPLFFRVSTYSRKEGDLLLTCQIRKVSWKMSR